MKKAFESIADAIGAVVDAAKWLLDKGGDLANVIGKIPFVGRGDGSGPGAPSAGAVAGLTGSDSTIDRGLWGALSSARQFGLVLTSGYRPGATTKHGTPSDHGTYPSKAIDVGGSASGMASFFRSLYGQSWVKQAFYDPLGSIFGGARSGYREGGHSDHVHVATYDRGGWLMPGLTLASNNTGRPERVGGFGGPTVIVNVAGSVTSERDLVYAVRDGLNRVAAGNDGNGLQ